MMYARLVTMGLNTSYYLTMLLFIGKAMLNIHKDAYQCF